LAKTILRLLAGTAQAINFKKTGESYRVENFVKSCIFSKHKREKHCFFKYLMIYHSLLDSAHWSARCYNKNSSGTVLKCILNAFKNGRSDVPKQTFSTAKKQL
jgi:ribosomal protein L22